MVLSKKLFLALTVLLMAVAVAVPAIWYARIPTCSVTTPTLQTEQRAINCTGSVIASAISKVSLGMPLFVKETYVSSGSVVEQGQKLFDVDREKILKLAAGGADDGFADLEGIDYTQVAGVMGSLGTSTLSMDALPASVYATDSGVIEDFSVENGSVIAANSTICTITSGSEHQLRLTVPEDQLGQFSVGCSVAFAPVAYAEREYYGKISNRAATVRRQLTTTGYKSVADIYVTVSDCDEFLADGMSVTACVSLPAQHNLLTVPYSAVEQDEKGEYVVVIQSGRAQKRYITTGVELDAAVEVTSGITLQDMIAENAASYRGEGELVRIP